MMSRRRIAVAVGVVIALTVAVVVLVTRGDGDDVAESTTTSTTAPSTTTSTTAPVGPTFPLLGTPIPEGEVSTAARPALVVKIDNADKTARPQAGLTNADVVYEPRVEGGVTRLLAVFHSRDANPVGPVRSFRTTDVDILRMLGRPLFAWHGTNGIARVELNDAVAAGQVVNVGIEVVPSLYYRESSRRAPHNSMSNTIELFKQAPQGSLPPPPLFIYGVPAGGEPITVANIDYGGGPGDAPVTWNYDAASGLWQRSQAGTPHVDESGGRVAVKNVVVQFTDYVDTGQVDTTGFAVPEATTVGEGEVWLLTEGQRFVGRWSRVAPTDVISYTNADGSPMEFSPGPTWVNLPPPGRATVG